MGTNLTFCVILRPELSKGHNCGEICTTDGTYWVCLPLGRAGRTVAIQALLRNLMQHGKSFMISFCLHTTKNIILDKEMKSECCILKRLLCIVCALNRPCPTFRATGDGPGMSTCKIQRNPAKFRKIQQDGYKNPDARCKSTFSRA